MQRILRPDGHRAAASAEASAALTDGGFVLEEQEAGKAEEIHFTPTLLLPPRCSEWLGNSSQHERLQVSTRTIRDMVSDLGLRNPQEPFRDQPEPA